MTREEAIEYLVPLRRAAERDDDSYRTEALTMAIEALKREDTMLKEIERVVLYGERGEVNG